MGDRQLAVWKYMNKEYIKKLLELAREIKDMKKQDFIFQAKLAYLLGYIMALEGKDEN
jgi:hypothetical protein